MKEKLNEFKSKLSALLEEYGVLITASDEYQGYPECGEDIQISFMISGQLIDGQYHESLEECFGDFINKDTLLTKNK